MPKLIPIIKAVRKGYSIDKNPPEWAYTLNSRRNHLKKALSSEELEVTIPSGSTKRIGYVIEHNLGYVPFVEIQAKGANDTDWKIVPAILSGTDIDIFAATTQGEYETVIMFYNPNIFTDLTEDEVITFKYTINIDPSRDAWDS
jgi:hypothetical protein